MLAYPAPEAGESLAAASWPATWMDITGRVCIRMPMVAARFPAQEVYDRAAVELGGHLDAGRDVAVLCEGDPFFYGSFMYMFGRMAAHHAVEVVPGCLRSWPARPPWARPLAARNDVLTVLPPPCRAICWSGASERSTRWPSSRSAGTCKRSGR